MSYILSYEIFYSSFINNMLCPNNEFRYYLFRANWKVYKGEFQRQLVMNFGYRQGHENLKYFL
jgi:hypothetical protein